MRAPRLVLAALLVAGLAATATATAAAALAWPRVSRPGLVLAGGGTFAVTGEPGGGGASFSVATLWPVAERVRFGLQGYADDLGTASVELRDVNDGSPRGVVADLHRWAYGAAWRAEADVWRRGRWAGSASGAWGWWRVEDDRRGASVAAGSAVGFRLGADARRPFGRGRELGLALNYHRLSDDPRAAWRRVNRYASAALELRWAGGATDD